MRLAYKAFDKTGREVTSVIDSPSEAEAAEELRRQDLFVAEISPSSDASHSTHKGGHLRFGQTRQLKNLTMFARQLYVLVGAGTPLAQALGALQRQARDESWRDVIADVRGRLERGASLSEAMEAHPMCFGSVCQSMVAAGEVGGNLPQMLNSLAELTQKRLHIRNIVRGAMIYPSLLVSVAVVVLLALMMFVIPRFTLLFDSLGMPLPPTTSVLIALSKMLRSYWWLLATVVGAMLVAGAVYFRTPGGKRTIDTVVLRTPYIGLIVRSLITAQLTRMLGVMLTNHLPILESLKLTSGTATNVHYTELLTRTTEAVTRGDTISSVFGDTDLISPSVYEAIRSGENSGQVGPLLLNLSDFLDEENEVALKSLTSILEPVVLILMGLLIGLVAISMFLPLFDVTAMTGGGVR